jgi:hypothetical protein
MGKTREGTKQTQLIAMLKRPEGAMIVQIVAATGWRRTPCAGLRRRAEEAAQADDHLGESRGARAGLQERSLTEFPGAASLWVAALPMQATTGRRGCESASLPQRTSTGKSNRHRCGDREHRMRVIRLLAEKALACRDVLAAAGVAICAAKLSEFHYAPLVG